MQARSTCKRAPRIRGADPGFGFFFEQLHSDQQQPSIRADGPDHLDSGTVVAPAAPQPARLLKDSGAE